MEKLEGRKNATETPSILRTVTTAEARRITKPESTFASERFKVLGGDHTWSSHWDYLVALIESRDVLKQVAKTVADCCIPVVYCDICHCPCSTSIFPDLKRKIRMECKVCFTCDGSQPLA